MVNERGPSLGTKFRKVRTFCEHSSCDGVHQGDTTGVWVPLESEPVLDSPQSPNGKVTGGKVVFTVPTAVTPGMSLTISAPWQGLFDNQMNVVLSGWNGDTSAPFIVGGDKVSTAQAKKRKLGSSCWAGTTKSKATIRISVAKIEYPGLGKPKRVTAPLSWASPTKKNNHSLRERL